jgi:GNAT superfamily N-acetyltransferase
VHLTGGILRHIQALSTPEQNPALEVLSKSAHPQETQNVGQQSIGSKIEKQRDAIIVDFKIEGPYLEKANLCTPIIRALPEWFGIEAAIVHYSTEIDILPTFLAFEGKHVVGFVSIKQHNPYSAEVYVMAVLPEEHHKGIGRLLINHSQDWLKSKGVQYLQVKTLGSSHPDKSYAVTRLFYEVVGFIPLEETTQIWDEHNPCLIMVKKL